MVRKFLKDNASGGEEKLDFDKLENYNSDIAQELLATPDIVLEHATEALRGMEWPTDIELATAIVRIRNLPELTRSPWTRYN
jgi:hypothetical protein